MAVNGVDEVNGQLPYDGDLEYDVDNAPNGPQDIPPAEAHWNSDYVKRITIPLNDTPAWTPTKRLRVVIIGAGYSGMMMAQKLQHKHKAEMDRLIDFVIYESRSTVGGTWNANTCGYTKPTTQDND